MRVVAAMSGGVDSAVAAARAVAAGHDVTGVHFALSADPAARREGARGCCTLSDARDARRAADVIGIPFYVWDLAERFAEDVIDDFLSEYAAGRTPNPCVRCNERIKFAAVLDRALDLGFDAVCTGHYARLDRREGIPRLRRAVDAGKDQSYVLAVLDADQLTHTLLPLGDSTKADVRQEAAARGLAVARKPDSHDICFIPDGDTRAWLAQRLGATNGPIVDADTDEVLGEHQGSYGFTIGQRRGLNLTRPASDGRPRYVVGVEPGSNTVFVGGVHRLAADRIRTAEPLWLDPQGAASLEEPQDLWAQIRAHGEPMRVSEVEAGESGLLIRLAEPARAVAAGQTVVLYRGDQVVASATISHSGSMDLPVSGVAPGVPAPPR
ncbi:MAG: tRNA 2-thiouridine(34) synthase MnmA [Actinobacteria bacterium]|nr:tRNA 2-thiouridine(34) synthase MnmA [Actinomycetota bacterium]